MKRNCGSVRGRTHGRFSAQLRSRPLWSGGALLYFSRESGNNVAKLPVLTRCATSSIVSRTFSNCIVIAMMTPALRAGIATSAFHNWQTYQKYERPRASNKIIETPAKPFRGVLSWRNHRSSFIFKLYNNITRGVNWRLNLSAASAWTYMYNYDKWNKYLSKSCTT